MIFNKDYLATTLPEQICVALPPGLSQSAVAYDLGKTCYARPHHPPSLDLTQYPLRVPLAKLAQWLRLFARDQMGGMPDHWTDTKRQCPDWVYSDALPASKYGPRRLLSTTTTADFFDAVQDGFDPEAHRQPLVQRLHEVLDATRTDLLRQHEDWAKHIALGFDRKRALPFKLDIGRSSYFFGGFCPVGDQKFILSEGWLNEPGVHLTVTLLHRNTKARAALKRALLEAGLKPA